MGELGLSHGLASRDQDVPAASTHPSWQLPTALEPTLKRDGEEREYTKSSEQTLSMRKDPSQLIFQFKRSFSGCETLEKFLSSFKRTICLKKTKNLSLLCSLKKSSKHLKAEKSVGEKKKI